MLPVTAQSRRGAALLLPRLRVDPLLQFLRTGINFEDALSDAERVTGRGWNVTVVGLAGRQRRMDGVIWKENEKFSCFQSKEDPGEEMGEIFHG